MGLMFRRTGSRVGPESIRAAKAWERIQDKPTAITIFRGATTLPEQTVRLEFDDAGQIVQTVVGGVAKQGVTIFGVLNHPDSTIDNTDLKEADRFVVGTKEYKVISVLTQIGEVQAYAIATT